jgi:hypothetical protein
MRRILSIAVLLALGAFVGASTAQDECDVTVTIGESCDSVPRLSIPVYLENPCPVGSFTFRIILPDYSWLSFDPEDLEAADTTGSRINFWPFFSFYVNEPDTIVVNAARIGYPEEEEPLAPGEGLIFTIHPTITEPVSECQLLRFGDGCFVYDESQYIHFGINYVREEACSGCDPGWLHGDIDKSGYIGLTDVIGMISIYRGDRSFCPGCPCIADPNGNGSPAELADVIAIIGNYRYGDPVMLPCE